MQDANSFVGYRVREKFADLPAPTDAVGRTSAVTGSLTVNGLQVTAVDVKADLRQLQSDKSMRDERIRTDGLQSDQFPIAEFTLSDPIVFPNRPAAGHAGDEAGQGNAHTARRHRNVTIPLQARWSGDQIEVAGSLPIVSRTTASRRRRRSWPRSRTTGRWSSTCSSCSRPRAGSALWGAGTSRVPVAFHEATTCTPGANPMRLMDSSVTSATIAGWLPTNTLGEVSRPA